MYSRVPENLQKRTGGCVDPKTAVRGQPVLRLHIECAMFDAETPFISSLSFDPRSREHNSEMGLMVKSPVLVRHARMLVQQLREEAAYRLAPGSETGALKGLKCHPDGRETVREPPAMGWLRRLCIDFLAAVIPEGLL
jgi:cardiolipin synthase C